MLAQHLIDGVLLGACYALFALGFTIIYRVLRVINLTYGVSFSAGAFAALFLTGGAGLSLWAALPLAALAAGAMAVVLDWLLLTHLRRKPAPELASLPELATLMVTLGGALALYSAATALLGPDIRSLPPGLFAGAWFAFGGLHVASGQLIGLAASVLLVGALVWLLYFSRPGLAIRATAENPDAAGLMGIDTGRMAALVSFAAGCLAGTAGVLIDLNINAIHPAMGEPMMLRGFVVVVVGGLGDIRGALIAGLALGVVEVLTAAHVGSGLNEAVAFAIMLAVLWTRPSGLFGRPALPRA